MFLFYILSTWPEVGGRDNQTIWLGWGPNTLGKDMYTITYMYCTEYMYRIYVPKYIPTYILSYLICPNEIRFFWPAKFNGYSGRV